ncbi:hypothetical protein GGQ84_000576 [Desulfitispora alkaliphila]|uniref:hypothetical protein n=1 Tax=Desulfitispora alkaliphila TaxID=622674 RepID=UPI003D1A79D5
MSKANCIRCGQYFPLSTDIGLQVNQSVSTSKGEVCVECYGQMSKEEEDYFFR